MQPAMLDSHPGWITLLLSNLRTITIISTAGRYLETAAQCRKALLELMPHRNKTRIPRAAEIVVFLGIVFL